MRLAFNKIYGNPDIDPLSFFVGLITFGGYSHVEILFELDKTKDTMFSINYASNKPRFTKLKKDELVHKRWDFVEIDITPAKELEIYKECLRLHNRDDIEYDTLGAILSVFSPPRDLFANKFFCSELCALLLTHGGIKLKNDPQQYTPVDLAKELKERRYDV